MIKSFFTHRYFVLFILFVVAEWVVNPVGEFCLNDDWSYAKTVEKLYQTGEYDIGYWPAMTLFSHVLWGYSFVSVFGFSFTILRFSTLVLSFITVLVSEQLCYRFSGKKHLSMFAALVILFNPFYFNLSNSYMTEITFLFGYVVSVYFYYLYQTRRRFYFLVLSLVFSLVCIFTRQFGLIIPLSILSFSCLSLLKNKHDRLAFITTGIFLGITIGLIYLYESWISVKLNDYSSYQGLFYTKKPLHMDWVSYKDALNSRSGLMLLYAGICLFPFIGIVIPGILNPIRKSKKWLMFSLLILVSLLIYYSINAFPIGNVLYNVGLGLETTIDTLQLGNQKNHAAILNFNTMLLIISILGLLLFFLTMSSSTFKFKSMIGTDVSFSVFITLTLVFYLLILAASSSVFDRYSLLFTTGLVFLYVCSSHLKKIQDKKWSYLFLLPMALFSILSTKDYFNYNRKKEEAIQYLKNDRMVDPAQIHGGFEYFMWNFYDEYGYSKWDGKNQNYLITFGPVDNYYPVHKISYTRFIPFQHDTIYILQKKEIH